MLGAAFAAVARRLRAVRQEPRNRGAGGAQPGPGRITIGCRAERLIMQHLVISLLSPAVVAAGVAAGVAAARRRFVVVRVAGTSMVPTYQPGDRVLIRRGGRAVLRRGQVVVFRRLQPGGAGSSGRASGLRETEWLIKRVAAMPGDRVPDQVAPGVHAAPGDVVPAGRLVVLGDGPTSRDSRHWGYLPVSEVLGVVIRRLS
ncbi:signal peptidase I [Microbispora rosea]|uniref:Signal peptidase I n=2 Tax=Microbispora rosea TaxID=58117 RepID=A0A1N7H945_9ACTN|nr:signal peptidase I [Microbispora rosea]